MSAKKLDNAFGLSGSTIDAIDWTRVHKRVVHDLRSDFIWAPHMRYLYTNGGEELTSQLKGDLRAGQFNPGVPLTVEVPKSFRIKVGGAAKRLGPSFSRPGSVLPPYDRLFYQALAEAAAPIIDQKIDKARSFSHRLADGDEDAMFKPNRTCWADFQRALRSHADKADCKYILRTDVADYFGSVNQHTLVNELTDGGYPSDLAERLEALLPMYAGQRSSRGLLQGMYPSDLFGAFYLHPVDRFFRDRGIASARYVDDMYVFVASVDEADKVLRSLIPELRTFDLALNEVKSTVIPKTALFSEEPDLEQLFADAVNEVSSQTDEEDADVDYGFQREWDEDEEQAPELNEELELAATEDLFSAVDDFPGHEESIERFCLPIFTKAGSDIAIDHVLDALRKRPSMTQLYAVYLGKFVKEDDALQEVLIDELQEPSLFDWQKMWIVAALHQVGSGSEEAIGVVATLLADGGRHDALRAVAANFVGRYGDHSRRRALVALYPSVSDYVKLAMLYSSKTWPRVERTNVRGWGGHGRLHAVMAKALS